MIDERFDNLNQAIYKGKRAPHKPLLILIALSMYQNGHDRLIKYKEIDENLKKLLIEYGPTTKSYKPELPFYHLKNDNLWELNGNSEDKNKELDELKSANKTYFINNDISGGFKKEIYEELNNENIAKIASKLLNNHFPETIHEDILNDIGLKINVIKYSRKRDPKFREEILRAYEYKCAICGFRAVLNGYYIGLDAAHIKWHQADGPDLIENGVTLCSMHHKLFDRGVFTIDDKMRICVSEKVTGTDTFNEIMVKFNGNEISKPQRPTYYPKDTYLEWHVNEVFHGPSRYINSV